MQMCANNPVLKGGPFCCVIEFNSRNVFLSSFVDVKNEIHNYGNNYILKCLNLYYTE